MTGTCNEGFLWTGGLLIRCDAPAVHGSYSEIAQTFGIKPVDIQNGRDGKSRCVVCRPVGDQHVYLTIHGQEGGVFGMVIWEQGKTSTFLFAASPFDLVVTVEDVARYERARYDLGHVSQLRGKDAGDFLI